MSNKIRVLIVDDLALRRQMLTSILESDPGIEVIGTAENGREGIEKTESLKPDVVTMDLQMPVMGGLEATEQIMQHAPTPIIIASSMDVSVIVKALGLGAMDFVAITGDVSEIADDLIDKVKTASNVKPIRRVKVRPIATAASQSAAKKRGLKVVAIGSSTGGPQALNTVLSGLPADFPAGIIIVQHMTKGFIEGLVDWLKLSCPLDVRVAKYGDVLKPGTVLVAPDEHNTEINSDAAISLRRNTSEKTVHVPSIDAMMKSAASSYEENSIGVIMTGMGRDGLQGMRAIKRAGGKTLAQDEKTSMIFGMNKAAIEAGCVDAIVPLGGLADRIVKSL